MLRAPESLSGPIPLGGAHLTHAFFARPSPMVAKALLGSWLVRSNGAGQLRVRISETEAYLGEGDPASHARHGPTARNRPMYGPPGHSYVYFIYGLHFCLNVVTGRDGEAEAVLLRAALPAGGAEGRLDGPARLCRSLGVDGTHNQIDMCSGGAGELWFERDVIPPGYSVFSGARVGVRDTSPLRFWMADSSVSATLSDSKRGVAERLGTEVATREDRGGLGVAVEAAPEGHPSGPVPR